MCLIYTKHLMLSLDECLCFYVQTADFLYQTTPINILWRNFGVAVFNVDTKLLHVCMLTFRKLPLATLFTFYKLLFLNCPRFVKLQMVQIKAILVYIFSI